MSVIRIRPNLLLCVCLLAWVTAAAQTGTGTGSGSGTGSRTTTPSRPTTTTPQQPQQQMPRPIFLAGAVAMADGSPIPNNVEIIRVCGGRNHREAYADSTGHFGFQVGQNTMIPDASTGDFGDFRPGQPPMPSSPGNVTNSMPTTMPGAELMGCELKASAPGFISSTLDLSGVRGGADDPNVGTIVLERMEKVPGTMMSATTYAAPKEAQKAFRKGMDENKKSHYAEAGKKFEEAAQAYPKFAEAWFQLGIVQQRAGQMDEARQSYRQAVAADSKFVGPYIQLAALEAASQNWPETVKMSEQAIALDPINFAGSYFFDSVANFNLGKVDIAEASARKAMKMDPQHRIPQIQLLLGRILMVKKDLPGAIENMKGYLARSPNAPDADTIRRQLETLQQASASQGVATAH